VDEGVEFREVDAVELAQELDLPSSRTSRWLLAFVQRWLIHSDLVTCEMLEGARQV